MPDHKDWVAMKPKLKRAFAALKKAGVRAEMNFADTLSDGIAEIHDPAARGYAFYHSQDHAHARAVGNVNIAFGAFGKRAKAIDIGRDLRDALVREGLFVQWPETVDSRPTVHLTEVEEEELPTMTRQQAIAALAAHKKQLLPAWTKAVKAAGVHEQLATAAASIESCLWMPYADYTKNEKRHDERAKQENKAIILLPSIGTWIPQDGKAVINLANAEAYGTKSLVRDVIAACKQQGLNAEEADDRVWVDLNPWKPSVGMTTRPTKAKVKVTSKTKTTAKTKTKINGKAKATKPRR